MQLNLHWQLLVEGSRQLVQVASRLGETGRQLVGVVEGVLQRRVGEQRIYMHEDRVEMG